jgi:methylated-DNA-protein-cysteine methyltransferase-like protein
VPTAETHSELYELIYRVVQQVPPGRVTTYGQLAAIVGRRADARVIGYAMAALPPGLDVPWQRVINSEGRISLKGRAGEAQRQLLEAEGVVLDRQGRIDFERFGWEGPEPDFLAANGLTPAPPLRRAERDAGEQLSLL